MAVLQETREVAIRASDRLRIFGSSFFCFLLALQTVYPYAYTRSRLLQTTILLPNAIRLSTWTVPVLLYLHYTHQNVLDYLKLRRNTLRGLAWGLAIGCMLISGRLVQSYLLKGHAPLNPHLGAVIWWKAVILVGFSEEVVFRGFFLPELAKRMGFWIANLAQAAMFLAVHIPGWILLGNTSLDILRMGSLVFFMGFCLGWVWKRSDSLWACMLTHSFNNFCAFG